ncbi:MAG: AarF/ABC1/UbiB kinase family protein, partial [Proteobacteria bacterium]|nr:AarF/ABC1/UbiB kinase family protein [Pseudomonadota bacterium]
SMLKHTNYEKEPDRNQLERDLSALIDQHLYRPLKELDVAKLLHQLLTITTKHRLSFKPDLFLMMKALSTAEILGRSLEPDFDLTRHAEPFVKNVQLSRLNPKRVTEEVVNSGIEFLRFFMGLPGELQDILDQARDGKIKIEFEHHGLNPMLSTHDRIVNRVVFAIVLASIIVGSSLIVLSGVPPKWNNIPVIGLSGYIIAVVMAFWLLWSILRHGKM